jgi:serine/threonine protein kinase
VSLHSHTLFHGYLKPTNVLLDSDHNVHLTDYLSFAFELNGLTGSSMVGFPGYVAPELFTGDFAECFGLDTPENRMRTMRIDVYDVGLLSYEILTGTPVFSPRMSMAEHRRACMNPQARPRIPSYIAREFGALITRCWHPEPAMRPVIGEVWQTLEAVNFRIIDGVDPDFVRERVSPMIVPTLRYIMI